MVVITLTTDFGSSLYVAQMKGAISSVVPNVPIIDIAHDVPPHNIAAGAFVLLSTVPFFHDAIHVGVVDPGVGTERAPIIVSCNHGTLVGPDNGLLAPAAKLLGVKAVHKVTNFRYTLADSSSTFHGRDIFAPVAAFLAKGVGADELGVPIERWMDLSITGHGEVDGGLSGHVVYIDRFGNCVVNIPGTAVRERFIPGERLELQARGSTFPMAYLRTYGLAGKEELLMTIGSSDFLELAVREGDAAARLGLHQGDRVTVRSGSGAP